MTKIVLKHNPEKPVVAKQKFRFIEEHKKYSKARKDLSKFTETTGWQKIEKRLFHPYIHNPQYYDKQTHGKSRRVFLNFGVLGHRIYSCFVALWLHRGLYVLFLLVAKDVTLLLIKSERKGQFVVSFIEA